jgi:tetratricopeptide (TPR) repeat protein
MTKRWFKVTSALVVLLFGCILLRQAMSWSRRTESGHLGPELLNGGAVSNRSACYGFHVRPPRTLTKEGLENELRQKLEPKELGEVVDPLDTTPEMQLWARRVTSGATNEMDKARLLYWALASGATFKAVSSSVNRTAKEVFATYQTTNTSALCLELAYLYVALASAVDLRACVASVEVDCEGHENPHCCAAVNVGGKTVLIDPIYSWFGVPHRKFRLMDQLEAIAAYLCERDSLEARRVACKLAPDLPVTRFGLFIQLCRGEQWDAARSELDSMIKLDPDGPQTLYARGAMATHDGKPDAAIELLRKAIERAPNTYQYHYALGYAYLGLSKWVEARAAYEQALRFAQTETCAEDCRRALEYIDSNVVPTNYSVPLLTVPDTKPR